MNAAVARYAARRLLVAFVILIVLSFLVYVALDAVPGNVARLRVGEFGTPAQVRLVVRQLGLDHPLLYRYQHWLGGFITGHWGQSWRLQTPLRPLVTSRLWNSVILGAAGFLVVVPFSLLAGVLSALKKDTVVDRAITGIGLAGIATPEIVTSMFLIITFTFWLKLLPVWSTIPANTSPYSAGLHLVMPIIALGLTLFGYIARMVRAGMIEELSRDYVRTAILKGIPYRTVVIRHVLRNALLPAITVVANQIPYLIGGQIVVENIFNYPGIGNLILTAALGHDNPMLEATTIVVAAVLLLSNLAADLIYGFANPRVRFMIESGARAQA